VLDKDANSNGSYEVTSVYFDDQHDTAYHQKQGGIFAREKFRVRFYNQDINNLRFECKIKRGELSCKETAVLQPGHFQDMLNKDYSFANDFIEPVWQKFNNLQRTKLMRPAAVVSFQREAYTYQAGNVRITFDSQLSASRKLDPLSMDYSVIPDTILEIKYDGFLPSVVSGLFSGITLNRLSISKYCTARERLWEVHQYDV
jgi:SPX domain protein involved in polyphosphate accumulation